MAPQIGLANVHSHVAWANYFIQYIKWIPPLERGVIDDVPGHNSSYKRDLLTQYGDRLESMLAFEHAMHQDLRRQGYELFLEPDAISYHLFMTKIVPFLHENFNIGRVYAHTLGKSLSKRQKLVRLASAPLMPFVRTKRAVDFAHSRGWDQLVPGIIPPLFRGLVFSALGEAVGWWGGPGKAMEHCLELDFHRERFVEQSERHRVLSDELYAFDRDPVTPSL